jgi:hypothetical protein
MHTTMEGKMLKNAYNGGCKIMLKKMSVILLYLVVSTLILSGCFLQTQPNCINKKISKFDKIIVNVDTSNMVIVGEYMGGNYHDSVREMITTATLDKIKKEFSNIGTLTYATNEKCSDHAVLIEGKVIIMNTHMGFSDRNDYEGRMDYRVINCLDKSIIVQGQEYARNKNFLDTPKEIGEGMANEAYHKLNECQ